MIMAAFIIPWCLYFAVVWLGAIQVRADGWYAAYLPHWADGAAHLSYMATFAERSHFPMTHPLFWGHPFTYSFVADMIGGLISRLGIPLWLSYNYLGLFLSIATVIALWVFFKTVTKSGIQSWIAGMLFMLSGGLGWKYLFLDRLYPTLVPESPFSPLLLTQRETTDIAWLNIIVGELIPQRAFLLALPLGVVLLIIWYKRFVLQELVPKKLLFSTGLIFGIMPIVHPHTTMVMSLVIVCWGIIAFIKNKRATFTDLLIIGVPTILIGSFLTITFLSPSVSSGFFRWYPGWLASSKQVNWLLFWWDNWGLFLPLSLIGTVFFSTKKIQQLLFPFWMWFILTNLFLFQPYDWDNSKILTWVYLLFSIPVSQTLIRLWKGSLFQKNLVFLVFVALTAAGGIDAAKMLDTKTYALQLANTAELQIAEIVKQGTPKDAIFLTATSHRNWVSMLTGRQILCGYLGWMWTYGIKAGDRVTDMRAMYAGSLATKALLEQYGVDYVVIGSEERAEFRPNEAYFQENFPVFTKVGLTTVYKVN